MSETLIEVKEQESGVGGQSECVEFGTKDTNANATFGFTAISNASLDISQYTFITVDQIVYNNAEHYHCMATIPVGAFLNTGTGAMKGIFLPLGMYGISECVVAKASTNTNHTIELRQTGGSNNQAIKYRVWLVR